MDNLRTDYNDGQILYASDINETNTVVNLKADKDEIPNIDQNYKPSSTNPQSGIAVAAAIVGKEDKANKIITLSDQSTNIQYPSAKCIYDILTTGKIVISFATGEWLSQESSIDHRNEIYICISNFSNYKLGRFYIGDIDANLEYYFKNLTVQDIIVDQHYNSSSINAQSGVAIAEALQSYYLKNETYTKTEVNNLIGSLTIISIEVVQSLPTQNIKTDVIYLVPKQSAQTDNIYDEYIYTNQKWEKIGDTEMDLSAYATKVSGATTGNFASLDANGNLTDSGKGLTDLPIDFTDADINEIWNGVFSQ